MRAARTCTLFFYRLLQCSLLCSALIFSAITNGQSLSSNNYPAAYQFYLNTVGDAAHIFTGSGYTATYPSVKGSPFFGANGFAIGSLSFRGAAYYQIQLKYDLVTQELVIAGSGYREISLPVEKVDSFILDDQHFIRLKNENAANAFYQQLYTGKNISLVAFRSRVVHKSLRAEDPSIFDVYDSYYIRREGRLDAVNSERALKKLLNLRNDQLKTGNWRKNFENSLRAAVEKFDLSTR